MKKKNAEEEMVPPVIPLTQTEILEDGSVRMIRVKPLTYTLMTWVKRYKGLEDTIDISDDENSAQWEITYTSPEDNEYSVYFNTDEINGLILCFIYYSGEVVLPEKISMAKNMILERNLVIPTGQFQIVQENSVLRYCSGINVAKMASSDPDYSGPHLINPQLIDNIFEDGIFAMNNFVEEFSEMACS